MFTFTRSCSFCGRHNRIAPGSAAMCPCGHRADLPRLCCTCPKCYPDDAPDASINVKPAGVLVPSDSPDAIDLGDTYGDVPTAVRPAGGSRSSGPLEPAMSEATVLRLCSLEYSFVRLDADLGDLREALAACAAEAPRCAVAAKQLKAIRRMLRRILDGLDEDVTAAVVAMQAIEAAPF